MSIIAGVYSSLLILQQVQPLTKGQQTEEETHPMERISPLGIGFHLTLLLLSAPERTDILTGHGPVEIQFQGKWRIHVCRSLSVYEAT